MLRNPDPTGVVMGPLIATRDVADRIQRLLGQELSVLREGGRARQSFDPFDP